MKPKLPSIIHSSPEFKEVRKTYQGINSTPKIANEKSIKRHSKHLALKNKMK
jgi:hypothetical protein